MQNPHMGSPLKSVFTPEEWDEVQKMAAKKVAAITKKRAKASKKRRTP